MPGLGKKRVEASILCFILDLHRNSIFETRFSYFTSEGKWLNNEKLRNAYPDTRGEDIRGKMLGEYHLTTNCEAVETESLNDQIYHSTNLICL